MRSDGAALQRGAPRDDVQGRRLHRTRRRLVARGDVAGPDGGDRHARRPGGRPLREREDILLQKLVWYRLGDEVSDRQLGDIIGVIQVQADSLDVAYLRSWAPALGVSDLLARAWPRAVSEAPDASHASGPDGGDGGST